MDSAGIRTLPLGDYDAVGVTAAGLYTVVDEELRGVDPQSGKTRWTVREPGLRPDPENIFAEDFGNILLVSWLDSAARIAYAADSGKELWRAPAEWNESEVVGTQFVRNDPQTGVRQWAVDYAGLGCAGPLSEDSLYLFESRGITLFRCPVNSGPAGADGAQIVGGLSLDAGELVWQRTVPDRLSFARTTNTSARFDMGTQRETVETKTGRVLASRTKSTAQWQLTMPDSAVLIMDSSIVAENEDFRLEEADGNLRWRAPLLATEEVMLNVGTGNVVLAKMRKRTGDYTFWLLAYDVRTGVRTVLAGPGNTGAGEKPTLDKGLDINGKLQVAPWGALVELKDGEIAVIPAQ